MAKIMRNGDRFNRSILISLCLHALALIVVVVGSSVAVIKVQGGGGVIDAVMIDLSSLAQQNDRAEAQQAASKQAEATRKAEENRQKQALKEKKDLERKRLKDQEADRIKADEAKKLAQAERQKAAQASAEAKKAAAKAESDRQAQEAKKRAELKKADDAKKASTSSDKLDGENSSIDSLINDLATRSVKPAGAPGKGSGKSGGVSGGAGQGQINEYIGQIQSAIERRLNDYSLYAGKTCDLKISLSPDGGKLINATIIAGDPILCQLARSAALEANIPKPPSTAVYNKVNNAVLGFEP